MDPKRKIVIASTVFLLIGLLSLLAALTTPMAKGAGASLVVTPSSGKQGSLASIVGTGFTPGTQMVLLCGSTNLGSFTASPEGRVDTTFTVRVPSGTYNIVARDGSTVFATTTYTVVEDPVPSTSSGSQTPKPTTTPYSSAPVYPTPTFTWFYPYASFTPKPAETGIPPMIIGVVAVAAIAAVISVTYFVRRRGGREPAYEDEAENPVSPPPKYYPRTQTPTPNRYGQTQTYSKYQPRTTMASRSSFPSRYGQVAGVTRVCPRCRRTVRADYSVCPHCNQRLK